MIKKDRNLLLLLTLTCLVWAACSRQSDPCLQPKTVYLRVGTYRHADTGTAIFDSLLPFVRIAPLETDPQVYVVSSVGQNVNKFLISLSLLRDSCRWTIQPDTTNEATDTLTFYYQRQLNFLSNACGYIYYFNLNSVNTTHHNIDSVIITTNAVNSNANVEHLKIYY